MTKNTCSLLFTALLSMTASAQKPPAFDVVSIKPNISGSGSSGSGTQPGGRFDATNVSVDFLVMEAFGIQSYQIIGAPEWVSSTRYNIQANTGRPEKIKHEELLPLLQSLLADRFAFRYHRQLKETPVYAIVPAKGGPKLTPHPGEDSASISMSVSNGKAVLTAKAISLADLATTLGRQVDRTVIDRAGLPGKFDLKLEWTREPTLENPGATVFTAMQEQLGLRLEPDKAPVESIVIDAIQPASPN